MCGCGCVFLFCLFVNRLVCACVRVRVRVRVCRFVGNNKSEHLRLLLEERIVGQHVTSVCWRFALFFFLALKKYELCRQRVHSIYSLRLPIKKQMEKMNGQHTHCIYSFDNTHTHTQVCVCVHV